MEKSKAWDFALGIIKVDNLKVSEEFLELVEKEKKGEITDENIKNFLDKKYIKLGGKKMIKGIEKLTKEQVEHMKKVNELHTDCVGLEYKEGMEIVETWIDERENVCVRLKNGNWLHYLKDNTWY